MTRLLVVDDHAPFRGLVREVLERSGFEIVGEADDGAAALAATAALRPDAVLLDIGLPDGDGFDFCERLTASGVTVVLMSSRTAAELAPRIAASSARAFLPKARLSAQAVRELLP
ncbi:response regulator [Demequina maris]|uniref:response regulator n=1 Tax=Demequina maris TaxID=1638982 RepID=UPI000782F1A9|nr:response regulator [Demequina maris]